MSVKYPRFLKKSEKKNENTKLSAQITDQSLCVIAFRESLAQILSYNEPFSCILNT